ncbi:MAG: hypothetical protein OXG58_00085 [Gemmatimonadetes bacterium]|nr:hypothetical protein [Gemmatimonadota bacterium]
MAVHDGYARFTAYELLLPDPEFPNRRLATIGAEARERGVDAGNPAAFVMLASVQGALAELREEGAGPESAHEHAGILFFAYHFWRAGTEVVLVRRKTVRTLLAGGAETVGEPAWEDGLAGRAGYVQLPQHLVWMESPDQPPESVDGFFWCCDEGGVLHLALVAGIRRDRPGFVVATVPPQPLAAMPGWGSGPAREGGGDFATALPGAELEGLVGIRTHAEVFKLAAVLLGRVAHEAPEPHPHRPPAAPGSGPRPSDSDPRPTRLPFAVL